MTEEDVKKYSLFRQCKKHNWRFIDSVDNARNPTKCPHCVIDQLRAELAESQLVRSQQSDMLKQAETDTLQMHIIDLSTIIASLETELAEASEKIVSLNAMIWVQGNSDNSNVISANKRSEKAEALLVKYERVVEAVKPIAVTLNDDDWYDLQLINALRELDKE